MKPVTRYAILLFAGIADLAIGIYAFALVTTQIITGLESLWIITLGLITTLTSVFLIYRILPVFLRIQRDEPVQTFFDERTRQIIHQAASNAFGFLIIALIVMTSATMALPKWGYILTWNNFVTALLIIWITSILIFYTSTAYYYWK
ncbi:MAG: hypothetical protein ACFFCH_08470 [Promethearchaeota archaeon]